MPTLERLWIGTLSEIRYPFAPFTYLYYLREVYHKYLNLHIIAGKKESSMQYLHESEIANQIRILFLHRIGYENSLKLSAIIDVRYEKNGFK